MFYKLKTLKKKILKTTKTHKKNIQKGGKLFHNAITDIEPDDLQMQMHFQDYGIKSETIYAYITSYNDQFYIYPDKYLDDHTYNKSQKQTIPTVYDKYSILNYQIFVALNYYYALNNMFEKDKLNTYNNFYFIDFQNLIMDYQLYNKKYIARNNLKNAIKDLANNNKNNLYIYVDTDSLKPINISGTYNNIIIFGLKQKIINADKLINYINQYCKIIRRSNAYYLDMEDDKTKNFIKYLEYINILNDEDVYKFNTNELALNNIINKIKINYILYYTSYNDHSYKKKKSKVKQKHSYFYQGTYMYYTYDYTRKEYTYKRARIPFFQNNLQYNQTQDNGNIINFVKDQKFDINLSYIDDVESLIGFGTSSIDDILLFIIAENFIKKTDSKKHYVIVSNDNFREFINHEKLGLNKMPNNDFLKNEIGLKEQDLALSQRSIQSQQQSAKRSQQQRSITQRSITQPSAKRSQQSNRSQQQRSTRNIYKVGGTRKKTLTKKNNSKTLKSNKNVNKKNKK